MRDEDASSVTVGKNERRLNTLVHYRVPDGCTLAVVTPPHGGANTRSNGQSSPPPPPLSYLAIITSYHIIPALRSSFSTAN